MKLIIGQQFGNIKSIKILMSHPVVMKKFGFNPSFLAAPISLLTKIYGFPPPPFSTSKRSLNSNIFVVSKILEKKISNFLEFGSGYGNIALTIAKLTEAKGICVDMDEDDVSTLNLLAKINNFRCTAVVNDILNYTIEEESLDLIYSLEVMEHIENDGGLLEKSFNALRKGGRFIFQTPFHFNQEPDQTEHEFGHVRNGYSEKTFQKINNGLLDFEYFRVGKRPDGCRFCGEEHQTNHPLKLVGIGTKK